MKLILFMKLVSWKICSQLSVCNFLLFKNPKILQDCEKNIYIKYCVFQPLDFMKVFSIKMSILNSFNPATFSVRPSPSPPCINITSQVIYFLGNKEIHLQLFINLEHVVNCLQKHPQWIFILGYISKIFFSMPYKKYVTWLLNVEWFIGGCKWSTAAMGENK